MMKIWMINETYVSDTGEIREKLHRISFLHEEKASEYMSKKIDELCDVYNTYSNCRKQGKVYYVVSRNLHSATIKCFDHYLELLTLETIPIELDES